MRTRRKFDSTITAAYIWSWAACLLLLAASVARAQYTATSLYALQPPAGLNNASASPGGAFGGYVVGWAAEPFDPQTMNQPPLPRAGSE